MTYQVCVVRELYAGLQAWLTIVGRLLPFSGQADAPTSKNQTRSACAPDPPDTRQFFTHYIEKSYGPFFRRQRVIARR